MADETWPTPLSERPVTGIEDLAAVGAGVARALGALHARGIVHGSVTAAHVLLDGTAPPRLCGFSAGGRVEDGFSPGVDVAALGNLLLEQLRADGFRPGGERQQVLSLAQRAVQTDLSAEELAERLAAVVPGHEPPGALGSARPRRDRMPTRLTRILLGIAVVVAASAAVAAAMGPQHTRPRPEVGRPSSDTTVARAEYDGGVFENDVGRWTVGAAGDLVTVGDWDCDGTATLALLRPATGAVHAFSEWAPTGRDLVADALGTVAGAIGVGATDADGDGCDELVVQRADAESFLLHPPDRL